MCIYPVPISLVLLTFSFLALWTLTGAFAYTYFMVAKSWIYLSVSLWSLPFQSSNLQHIRCWISHWSSSSHNLINLQCTVVTSTAKVLKTIHFFLSSWCSLTTPPLNTPESLEIHSSPAYGTKNCQGPSFNYRLSLQVNTAASDFLKIAVIQNSDVLGLEKSEYRPYIELEAPPHRSRHDSKLYYDLLILTFRSHFRCVIRTSIFVF